MVKCKGQDNGNPCEYDLPPEFKVCPMCGTKPAEVSVFGEQKQKISVPCPLKKSRGQICGSAIYEEQNYCEGCGWEVNPKVFKPGARLCHGTLKKLNKPCDNIVTPETMFCSTCGTPPEFGNTEFNAESTNEATPRVPETSEESSADRSDNTVGQVEQGPSTSRFITESGGQPPSRSVDNSWINIIEQDLASPEYSPCLATSGSELKTPSPMLHTSDSQWLSEISRQGHEGTSLPFIANSGQERSEPSDKEKDSTWIMIQKTMRDSKGEISMEFEQKVSQAPSTPKAKQHASDTALNSVSPGEPPSEGSLGDNEEMKRVNDDKAPTTMLQDEKICNTKHDDENLTPLVEKMDILEVDNNIAEKGKSDNEHSKGQKPSQCTSDPEEPMKVVSIDHNAGQNTADNRSEAGGEPSSTSDDTADSDTETDEIVNDKAELPSSKGNKRHSKKRKKNKEKYIKKKLRKGSRNADTSAEHTRDTEQEKSKKITIKRLDESVKNISLVENPLEEDADSNFSASTRSARVYSSETNKSQVTDREGTKKNQHEADKGDSSRNTSDKNTASQELRENPKYKQSNNSTTESNGAEGLKGEEDKRDPKKFQNTPEAKTSIGQQNAHESKHAKLQISETQNKDSYSAVVTGKGKEDSSVKGNGQQQKIAQGVQTRSSSYISVQFLAMLPQEYIVSAASVPIVHVYDPTSGECWMLQMDVNGQQDGFLKVTGNITFPKTQAHRKIRYTYLVSTNDIHVYEYVYDYRYPKDEPSRYLEIPWTCTEQWIQYDGVIRQKPALGPIDTFLSKFSYFEPHEKILKEDLSLFARSYVPVWQNFYTGPGYICSGKEMLSLFSMLESGLKKAYLNTTKTWNKQDAKFVAHLGKMFFSVLEPVLKRVSQSENPDLVTVIGLVCLIFKYGMPLDNQHKPGLFKALLLKPDFQNKTCPQYDILKEQFKGEMRLVCESLTHLIEGVRHSDDPIWLCSIPLFHLLLGKCKPFETVSDSSKHDERKPTWWGVVEISEEIEFLKGKTKWKRSVADILNFLMPLFEMDYLLPRTFMAALSIEKYEESVIKAVPMEVVMAGLVYHLRKNHLDDLKKKIMYKSLELLQEKMISYTDMQAEQISGNELVHAQLSVKIAKDLLTEVLKYTYTYGIGLIIRILDCFLKAVALYEVFVETLKEKDKRFNSKVNYLVMFDDGRKEICDWLTQRYNFVLKPKEDLKLWSRVLSTELPHGNVKVSFMAEIKNKMEKEMFDRKGSTQMNFVDIYCEDLDMFSEPVQDILGKVVFEALEKGCVLEDKILKSKGAERYGNLLSSLFERSWQKRDLAEPSSILEFTLSWPSFVHFIKMFYQGEKSKLLSEECGFQLTRAASMVQEALKSLLNGTICIKDLKILLSNEKGFMDTSRIMSTRAKTEFDEDYVQKTLYLRSKELKMFEEMKSLIEGLIDVCQHVTVDTSGLEKSVRLLDRASEMKIIELCKLGLVEKIADLEKYEPTIIYFNIPEEILSEIPLLLRRCRGVVFMNIWIRLGSRAVQDREALTVEEMMEQVWEPAHETWTELGQKIRTGKIKFRDFNKHFKDSDSEYLERELQHFVDEGEDDGWIKERIRQVEMQRILEKCVDSAKVILDVINSFELEGNFDQVVLINDMAEGQDIEMHEMNRSMIDTCNILMDMGIKESICLKEFVNAKPLVMWLKESMEGLKELKVFVDLASISAGEGDMEVAKVKCLHAATTGYAPLIFNLDKTCDCEKFLEKCKEVWKELASDPRLPKKLSDTQRELEWLKTVKKSHGSVEVTSMYQAEAINSVGIYRIGRLQPEMKAVKLTIDDVLELHVQEDEKGSRLRKKYEYKELHELQSKLMLVAGKAEQGKDDVDKFTMVLDSVVRLCNVYVKLLTAGCVLFKDWEATLWCDPCRPVCTVLRFAIGENSTQLKGRRSKTEDVATIIFSLAKFMENALEEWHRYIEEKRDQYKLLNFFTIDQMVILQKELVKVGLDSEPSNRIYPLLSAVKHDCTKSDLITAMKLAKEDVQGKTAERTEETDEDMSEDEVSMEEDEEEDQVTETFIAEMVKAGYTESLAKAALQHTDPDDIDQGIAWCTEHEDDDVEMETTDEQKASDEADRPVEGEKETFEGWTSTGKLLSSVTEDLLETLKDSRREEDNLIQDLKSLWSSFLNSISSSVDDYLSVEHLGLILQRLSELDSFDLERSFLPCFEDGVPNLLMCPEEEVLNTVLTIYGHDRGQPLPQADEVLLCTPHTTLDEFDIFMRRAIFSGDGRVHCLVNGDQLDYEVSDKGERRLEKHMQKAQDQGIPYRLVVICCVEYEYKSRIVAALDKYRRPPLPLMATEHIRNYILQKLKTDESHGPLKPAASVDFERSTVRVVKSWRAGVGKTLYKQRMAEELQKFPPALRRQTDTVVSIPLHEREISVDEVMKILLIHTLNAGSAEPRLFHIDIYYEVQEGVDSFLFQLLILGCVTDSCGYVWRKLPCDLYLIETMPLLARDSTLQDGRIKCMHKVLDILPDIVCRSPQESMEIMNGRRPIDYHESDLLFDDKEFKSPVYQRPYQYLLRQDLGRALIDVDPSRLEGDKLTCVQTLLRHCGIRDPSWSELKHFVWFLNSQLANFETSAYCGSAAAEDLPGFAQFVLRFQIQMSRDFATRSLQISEEPAVQVVQRMDVDEEDNNDEDEALQGYQMRRTWESSPHPYLFFNPDQHSITFLGFNINRQSGDLIDTQTGNVLERNIMQRQLQEALHGNRVNLSENFDSLPRGEKITKLCSVMGVEYPHDPDETYELTTDNVKKILAIYMRFRCDIPVIIMGETGCGKTRLIKFMCSLQTPPGVEVQNMVLMKVHGGTRSSDIMKKVREAEEKAQANVEQYGLNMYTVLFFDEANTTEAIGIIKEIMCDHSMGGKPLRLCNNLKIVAACNPYRKHSDDLIKRLEQAGLGYHVDADKTTDRLGKYKGIVEGLQDHENSRVPMRRLVYRVQPLPQSMLPLVWDFGQLDTQVEELYIKQMVLRYVRNGRLPGGIETVVSRILTASQEFMREQKDECSFVSLRDVERVLEVMSWFYQQSQGPNSTILFNLMDESSDEENESEDEMYEESEDDQPQTLDMVTRSLVLALGVCYHACLKNREAYRQEVSRHFSPPCSLPGGAEQMLEEITGCQDVFLENVQLEQQNIARNQALKENLFMMVVCIELRIPLFLVGKPGSSKSLAKTIVTDAMQGNAAHKDLFKYYKQVQMVSFQCSPLSVPEGIVGTFRQCAMYQKDKDLSRFVSVVVLDEVGLAEDSPRMPLKTLHPLLEDGCQGDETPEPYKKVAFIGISNWALDPAKMNRGILVQREVPDREDLIETGHGICSNNKKFLKLIKPLIEPMADSYLQLFEKVKTRREFFGLRDFYSLLKMVYGFAAKCKRKPSWLMLKHSIMRNFGGFEDLDPLQVFTEKMTSVQKVEMATPEDPDCTAAGLIQACLTGDSADSETRYLLLLTENYGALTVLQQKVLTMNNAITIFGSSFPSDQEYTQVCRNINRIKVCMETGSTVVLLNLENLYESLYDALNQYYVYFGGERYVDLGLGTHRVKCRVHKEFRLIVVAEKNVVYNKFPIPLINRLEKHFLTISNMLTPFQLDLSKKLDKWAEDFVKVQSSSQHVHARGKPKNYSVGDVFMGYHADTCASIILHVSEGIPTQNQEEMEDEILASAKTILLWCATPESLLRLPSTKLASEEKELNDIYSRQQKHDSLLSYLTQKLRKEKSSGLFAQVTTHSKLLSTSDVGDLSKYLAIPTRSITLLTLQSFDTEQQFCRQIRGCLEHRTDGEAVLIVQCDSGDQNAGLVACARYCVQDELHQAMYHQQGKVHVVFVIQLPRVAGGCFTGFQCGLWHSVHIDELRPPDVHMPTMEDMRGKSVGALLDTGPARKKHTHESMDIEMAMEGEDLEMSEGGGGLAGVNVEEVVEENPAAGQVPIIRRFDIGSLIFSCVHAALAKVKDADRESTRNTDRVRILLMLLHQRQAEGCQTFLSGLRTHLTALMKEREEKYSPYAGTHWLSAVANKTDEISRAGTFRKTLVQFLADTVTPILAGIIAYLDTNQNLDILANNQTGEWQHQLWLDVVNNPSATQLEYSLLTSPGQGQELQEIIVKGTRHDGHTFPAQMPFSWLIFKILEGTLKTSKDLEYIGEMPERVTRVTGIIQELPLGQILASCQEGIQETRMAYVSDFVYMIYPVTCLEEHQLVCENLVHGVGATLGQSLEGILPFCVGVHVTYHAARTRLANYSNIQSVWPECSKNLIEFQQKSAQFYLLSDEEMTLDVLGLFKLMEKVQPSKEMLNDVNGRSNWLRLVHQYRPVIERILGYFDERSKSEDGSIGRRCQEGIQSVRHQWTRVTVVKLFIEHVCTTDEQTLTIKRCMPLWVMLKDDVDMKSRKSLDTVEKFLKLCNKEAVSHFFGKQEKCTACESDMEEKPVTLPCNDMVCMKCFNDARIMKTFQCPVCYTDFPEDFQPEADDTDRAKIEHYNNYRKRCNSFFMEVVSQLCFAEGAPPSQEVIQKLLAYITREPRKGQVRKVTKEMSVFDDGLDPNPVFRSFLLQLLIRTSTDVVTNYLKEYLEDAEHVLRDLDESQSHLMDVSLLVIQCLEDSYHQDVSRTDKPSSTEIKCATNMLKQNTEGLMSEELSVEKLYCLAEVRYALTITAKYLQNTVVKKIDKIDPQIRRLMDAAGKLCEECGSKWPKVFLIKYICRFYGTETYQKIYGMKEASIVRWVTMPELHKTKVVECADRYIACGEQYKHLREKLTQSSLNNDSAMLEKAIKHATRMPKHQTQIVVLLALYREVTMSSLYPESQQRFTPQAIQGILDFLIQHEMFKDEPGLVKAVCENSLWKHVPMLNIHNDMELRQQNTVCLMVHLLVVLLHLPGETTIIEPLRRIALEPQKMKQAFLPTMPQDDVAEIKEALLAARGQNQNDNPVFFRCPNGHPYVIGDCGRPYYVGTCKDCGAEIGGRHHNPLPGNVKVEQWLDQTAAGHILGRAGHRKTLAIPERKLTSAQCAILRLLTHISMYLGANENPQAILEIIKPDIDSPDLFSFLWDHIQVDLDTLQTCLGRSTDDVFLLLHHVCHLITEDHSHRERKPEEMCALQNKAERMKWEEKFSKKYIAKPLQDTENLLKDLNKLILNDQRLGSDPLLCLLFETDSPAEQVSSMCLHNNPAVWRYRAQINMDHLSNTFMTQMSYKCPVLRMFLEEEHHLRAIRTVPSILRLQKYLIQKYQRKLAKAEATTLTITDMLEQMEKSDEQMQDTEQLIRDFTEAWDCVRQDLMKFTFPTASGVAYVPKEYCRKQITYNSPISMLLPTNRDAGLCSYGLLYFLLKKQNAFLEKYCKHRKIRESTIHKVSISDMTPAHLISYHPDRDILPMVLANCNYSFEVGKGTKVEYSFRDFERQLMDRFLFSKSFIDISMSQIEVMTYRSEFTNAVVFQMLRERINQEPLTPGIRHQVIEEFRSYTDLCDCLDRLDITISFLKSVGGSEDMKLEHFMTQTLKMDSPIPSQKARQSCCCRHIQSLWLTLSMQKTRNQATYKHDTFEGIGEELREDLTEDQREVVQGFCEDLQPEKLEVLFETLFECIMLRIAVPQNRDDPDYVDTTRYSLHDVMVGYTDNPGYSVDLEFPDWMKEVIDKLPDSENPLNILASQAVDVWLLIYSIYGLKSNQRH